ncbi:MAG: outer membrane protein [Halocynthiibacter sp.]
MKNITGGAIICAAIFGSGQVALAETSNYDWSGAYAGITYSDVGGGMGTYIYSSNPGDAYSFDGTMAGIFGGYNFQKDRLVYGAELSWQAGKYNLVDTIEPHFNNMIDARARIGYAADDVLLFGFVGASSGEWDNVNGLTNPRSTGVNYGIGVDFKVGERMMFGLEYIQRDMSVDFDGTQNSINKSFNAVQLRAAYTF